MAAPLAERIVKAFVENGIIPTEDHALYTFGLHQLWFTLLNAGTTIIVGLLFGMVWESLVFLIAYIPLRKFAGGYHAKTEFRCYLLSTLIIVLGLLAVKYFPVSLIVTAVALSIGSLILFLLAPVEDANKPLDVKEIAVYRLRARVVLFLEWFASALFLLIGARTLLNTVAVAVVILSLMLSFGALRNRTHA